MEAEGHDINVLLLGKSGSGKTTLINSHNQYKTFDSFQQAVTNAAKEIYLNQSSYSLEAKCESYDCILAENLKICWIEASGFSEKRLPQIVNYIEQFQQIHLIALVISGTQQQEIAQLKYFFSQILLNFDKLVIKNLVFIITHSSTKSTDKLVLKLKVTLDRIKKQLQMSHINLPIFLFENAGYKNVKIVRSSIKLPKKELQTSETYWRNCKSEFQHLIEYAKNVKPYEVSDVVLRTSVFKFAEQLSGFIREFLISIEINTIELTRNLQNECLTENELVLRHVRTEFGNYEKIVCTSEKCVKVYQLSDGRIIRLYPQICCHSCRVPHIMKGMCQNFHTGSCMKCGCSKSYHHRLCSHSSISYTQLHIENERNVELFIKEIITKLKNEKRLIERCIVKLLRVMTLESAEGHLYTVHQLRSALGNCPTNEIDDYVLLKSADEVIIMKKELMNLETTGKELSKYLQD